MSKISVIIGIFVVLTGLLINYVFGYDNDVETSAHDIAMMHMAKLYDVEEYDVVDVIICDDTNGESIHYKGYGDGKQLCDVSIYREIGYDCLTGNYDDIHD